MKTASELILAFLKGQKVGRLSAKQASWLFSLAGKEGILVDHEDTKWVNFDGSRYIITKLFVPTRAYGGYVGRGKSTGNWQIAKYE